MLSTIATVLVLTAAAAAAPAAAPRSVTSIEITPHDSYSSAIGVLGCYVDTNRIAYIDEWPSCGSPCIEVSANGRTVNLLHVDKSGGAYDISYDAWNYLKTGFNATEPGKAESGGKVTAEYQRVGMERCNGIIKTKNGKLPLMATNSMNHWSGCGPNSWIQQNSDLYNIQNCACTFGVDEVCTPPPPGGNQASCQHGLGNNTPLSGLPVYNVEYTTGKLNIATQ